MPVFVVIRTARFAPVATNALEIYYLRNAEKTLHDPPRINYLQALLAHPYWNRPSRPTLLVNLSLVSVAAQEFFSKKNRPTVRIQRRRGWDGWCQGPFEALLLKALRCYSAVSEPQAASGRYRDLSGLP